MEAPLPIAQVAPYQPVCGQYGITPEDLPFVGCRVQGADLEGGVILKPSPFVPGQYQAEPLIQPPRGWP
jgi:hypothetical protein